MTNSQGIQNRVAYKKKWMSILLLTLVWILPTPFLVAEEMPLGAKIFVAGHNGLVGRALVRKLTSEGYTNIVMKSSKELDLRVQAAVNEFFRQEKIEYVFLAAAKVGGIHANSQYPAEFIYDNLMIETNVINAAFQNKVKKLLFLGSSCIYPRDCPQPIVENYLLTGPLESTNEFYALAKIAGIKLCQSYNRQYGTRFISCMPTNLYGPYDNFDLKNSHVLPALIRKFTEAKRNQSTSVVLWGTGKAKREFLHVDDLADASVFLMQKYEGDQPVNIGWGKDLSIYELALMIKRIVGYEGNLIFDSSYPDGTPIKLLDTGKIQKMGWSPRVTLEQGLRDTVDWYNAQKER
jgi:GDP-L-fucose synthase